MVAVERQNEDGVLESFPTLSILQLIKDAQQKHGLRHGDYQRYRYAIFLFYFVLTCRLLSSTSPNNSYCSKAILMENNFY